jgi:hypothetical protein
MQTKPTTSPPSASPLVKLAEQLAAAERTYDQSPTRRNLSRVTICYHRLYWATQAEAAQ